MKRRYVLSGIILILAMLSSGFVIAAPLCLKKGLVEPGGFIELRGMPDMSSPQTIERYYEVCPWAIEELKKQYLEILKRLEAIHRAETEMFEAKLAFVLGENLMDSKSQDDRAQAKLYLMHAKILARRHNMSLLSEIESTIAKLSSINKISKK